MTIAMTTAARAAPQPAFDVDARPRRLPDPATQQVHGKPLVYLDNAATTQKPQAVIDAHRALLHATRTPTSTAACTCSASGRRDAYEGARANGARASSTPRDAREIIFVARHHRGDQPRGADLRPRARSAPATRSSSRAMEHHSNIVPWQMLCEETGARLRVVPINDAGELRLDEFERLLSRRARGSSRSSHVSNALGTINPVDEIVAAGARARRSRCCVDGAQAVAAPAGRRAGARLRLLRLLRPQDVRPDRHRRALRQGRAARGDAALPGRRRHDHARSPSRRRPTTTLPYKFEAGTPNIAGAVGLGAAIDYLTALGLERDRGARARAAGVRHRARSPAIAGRAHHRHGAASKAGVLSFVLDGVHPHDIGTILDREGIAVRTGHHCCQPLMDRFGVPATARASLALYNTREEIDALVAGARAGAGGVRLMSDLRDLYQEVILDHNRRPRNFRALEGGPTGRRATTRSAATSSRVYVRVDGRRDRRTSAFRARAAPSRRRRRR